MLSLLHKNFFSKNGVSVLKKILYLATNSDGKIINSFVEANTNKEAINLLSQNGYSNIKLYDDASFNSSSCHLDDFNERQLSDLANHLIISFKNPSFINYIMHLNNLNNFLILVSFLLWCLGSYFSNDFLMAFGVVFILLKILDTVKAYRQSNSYNKLLKFIAKGQTKSALKQIDFLRKYLKEPENIFDLEIKRTYINKKIGNCNIDVEMARLEKFRKAVDEISPEMYDSRVALIYHNFGLYDKYLESLRNAYNLSSDSPVITLDMAIAEARLGDLTKAELLKNKVVLNELPVYGIPFFDWLEGAIAFRKGDIDADKKLGTAFFGLSEYVQNPAIWPSLSVCLGDYALTISEKKSMIEINKLLHQFWYLLNFYGEKELIDKLVFKYPSLRS